MKNLVMVYPCSAWMVSFNPTCSTKHPSSVSTHKIQAVSIHPEHNKELGKDEIKSLWSFQRHQTILNIRYNHIKYLFILLQPSLKYTVDQTWALDWSGFSLGLGLVLLLNPDFKIHWVGLNDWLPIGYLLHIESIACKLESYIWKKITNCD